LVLLATDAFQRYQNATGATVDKTTHFLTISPSDYAALKPLSFNINGVCYRLPFLYHVADIDMQKIFDLTPNAQTWPRPLNTAIGGKAAAIYLIIGDLGQPSGKGSDFTNGYTFLERFYTVYDTANKRIGFAPTSFTDATTN
jgi:cathepsin E